MLVCTQVIAQSVTTQSCQNTDYGLVGTLEPNEWAKFDNVTFGNNGIILNGIAAENQIDPEFLPDELEVCWVEWTAPQDGTLSFEYLFIDGTNESCFEIRLVLNNGILPQSEAAFSQNLYEGDELRVALVWFPDVENCLGNATVNIDSLIFQYDCRSGCTYSQATNYNSFAVIDDGTCEFTAVISPDFNGDGVVGSLDLMEFLSSYGSNFP